MTMSRAKQIESILTAALPITALEVIDESHQHSVPEGAESHFKATIVSDAFDGMPLIKRHRLVHQILGEIMQQIHALALHTYTPAQWHERADSPDSPQCRGGSRVG